MKPMKQGEVRACTANEVEAVEPVASSPSLANRGVSLATAAVQFVLDGCTLSGVAVANKRLDICRGCDWFKDNECRICGCYMPVKVYIAAMSCPDDPPKWDAVKHVEK